MGGGSSLPLLRRNTLELSSRLKAKSVLFITGASQGKDFFCSSLRSSSFEYIDPRDLLPSMGDESLPGWDEELVFIFTMELLYKYLRETDCEAFIM